MSNAFILTSEDPPKLKHRHICRWDLKNASKFWDPAIVVVGLDNWPRWNHGVRSSRNFGSVELGHIQELLENKVCGFEYQDLKVPSYIFLLISVFYCFFISLWFFSSLPLNSLLFLVLKLVRGDFCHLQLDKSEGYSEVQARLFLSLIPRTLFRSFPAHLCISPLMPSLWYLSLTLHVKQALFFNCESLYFPKVLDINLKIPKWS